MKAHFRFSISSWWSEFPSSERKNLGAKLIACVEQVVENNFHAATENQQHGIKSVDVSARDAERNGST